MGWHCMVSRHVRLFEIGPKMWVHGSSPLSEYVLEILVMVLQFIVLFATSVCLVVLLGFSTSCHAPLQESRVVKASGSQPPSDVSIEHVGRNEGHGDTTRSPWR
jgi:hypothetical protein